MTTDLDSKDGMPTRAALAQEVLLLRMRMLSNLFHDSDWVEDLEIDIWEMTHSKPHRFADHEVSPEMAKYFRDLIELGGGFWVWPEVVGKEGDEELFIPLEEWHQILPKLKNP